MENKKVLNNINALLNYENVKDYLFINVINANTHKQELENMPHTIVGDLAIVYRIMIQTTGERFCSAKITNKMMDAYGIDVNTLHNDALISSPNMMKPEVLPIQTMMMGISKENAFQDKKRQIVVLTNEHKTDGSATMFYAGVLNDLAEKLEHDLYIIPSSTDECIVLCDSPSLNINRVKEMLRSVNNSDKVPSGKKLSDHLYHYDKDEHILEKADDYEKRINKYKYSQLLH